MSRPEVDRPICLLDNRDTYLFVVPGPEVEFSSWACFFLDWLPLLLTKLTKSCSYLALSNESPVTSVVPT